jgi:succinate dehydrogenase / fumarate reductase, membrane anchor subunit
MAEKIRVEVMRSQLGRVRGTGSARSGVHHWYAERVTAIALIPLTLWFIYAVLHLVGAPQPVVAGWVAHPWNTVLLLALIAATFYHMQLGLQVVYEDYIDAKWFMNVLILATKAASYLLGLAAAVAVLRLAFTTPISG